MSYAVGNGQFPIRDFRRAISDENPGGNGSNFHQDFHLKSLVGNYLSLIAPRIRMSNTHIVPTKNSRSVLVVR